MANRRADDKAKGRTMSAPDPDERAALEKAAEALRGSSGDPMAAAEACISAWIMERTTRAAANRTPFGEAVVTLKDTHHRAVTAAALPRLLVNIPDDFPWSKSLMTMSKDEAIYLFTMAYRVILEQFVSMNEDPNFPFDDEIPF